MNNKYVVSLEVAKLLKENGFEQDTEYIWVQRKGGRWELHDFSSAIRTSQIDWCAAPCVGRLGEELLDPSNTELYDGVFYCSVKGVEATYSKSEADCRALMWIELKKRGLLDDK